VCVDGDVPVDDKQDVWTFGEFPKVDSVVANSVKAHATEVKLSSLRYIDVDVEGRHCKGLVVQG